MRPLLPTITLLSSLMTLSPCAAQTLSSRPIIFADPVLGTDPSYGELILGRTTLTAALRIFAVELQDSVRMPLGHPSNPDTLGSATQFAGLSSGPKPHHRLDLGSGRYTLYFDKHERLVAASTHHLPRVLRREELVARYPTLKLERRWRTAEDVPTHDQLVASLGPCVALTALVRLQDNMVRDFGYVFTCATTRAPQKAALNLEP
jgi:hypothetical protein